MASTAHLTALALGPLPRESVGGRRLRGGAWQAEERHEGGRGGGAERVYQEIQQHHITHCRARLLHTAHSRLSPKPIPIFIRAHGAVQPPKKTSDECMCARRKCIEGAGFYTGSQTTIHHHFVRASYSGPPSAEPPYYRGQEVTRSPQVPFCPLSLISAYT